MLWQRKISVFSGLNVSDYYHPSSGSWNQIWWQIPLNFLPHASQLWAVITKVIQTPTNIYISLSGMSYKPHHNKYDRQMGSFGGLKKKKHTYISLIRGKAQTLPGPFLQLFHFFFCLNLICINKDQWIPSLTTYLLTWCGRIYGHHNLWCMCVQTLNLNLKTPRYHIPNLQKYREQRTMLNLINKTIWMQSAKSRNVQKYRTSESFSSINKLQEKKKNPKEVDHILGTSYVREQIKYTLKFL